MEEGTGKGKGFQVEGTRAVRKWPRLKKREWCLLSPPRKASRVGGRRMGKAGESRAGEGSRNQILPCDSSHRRALDLSQDLCF